MTDAIDLTKEQRKTLNDLLCRFLPGVAVWAYGSRVKWTARPNSDLDLVAFTTPAQRAQVADLKEALAESNLPFPVDLHVWDDVPERFREIIRKEYIVVQGAKTPQEPVVADGWRTKTVWELQQEGVLLVEDGNHGEYRPRSNEFVSSGVAFIRAADMDAGRVVFDSASKINDTARQRITKGIGAPGDALLSHKGTVGKVALVHSNATPFVCSPQTTFWRTLDEERLNRRYLYAFLRSPEFRSQLATRSGETDMAPYVSLTSQRGLSVKLPPIQEQRAIAHILGTLDDKIEMNRQMNETLETMARVLFKSWFVDFNPVRAKAERRDTSLPKHVADLFPDSFEDSELGESPKGWRARSLYEAAEFVNGAAFRSEDFCDPSLGLPIVRIAELKDGISGQTKYSERILEPKQLIETGDLLYSWSGSPDTSLDAFLWTNGRGLLNQHIFKVITPTIAEKRFVYYLLKFLKPALVEIARNKQTTGLGHVTVADMKRLSVCSPHPKVLSAFDGLVAPLFDKAFSNTIESQILAALRDALLPKLISGDVRVKNVEKFIEVTSV